MYGGVRGEETKVGQKTFVSLMLGRERQKFSGEESPTVPVSECCQNQQSPVKMEGFPPGAASMWRADRSEIGPELLKNGRENCPYGAFLRLGGRFRAAKTGFLC